MAAGLRMMGRSGNIQKEVMLTLGTQRDRWDVKR